ncbi:aspartyl-phosphate phosphatase Spo0E family protein [Brevibacillus laterosporus]|uniref:aspartyl-phosphate phosphatase Spo0E family protein n=1 Tax=Brevibacillus laterosporus TaxID=1465 RepID=UPI002E1FA3E9
MNNKKCYSGKLYHSIEGGESINSLPKNDLLKAIEDLQQKLVELYRTEGSFLNPTVLQLSQQLDVYIVLIQKMAKNLK